MTERSVETEYNPYFNKVVPRVSTPVTVQLYSDPALSTRVKALEEQVAAQETIMVEMATAMNNFVETEKSIVKSLEWLKDLFLATAKTAGRA